MKGQIADKKPTIIELKAGKYYWCACGKSQNQPFCDGSHKGSGFSPIQLDLTETRKLALCNCKQTGKPPLCDGTHKKL